MGRGGGLRSCRRWWAVCCFASFFRSVVVPAVVCFSCRCFCFLLASVVVSFLFILYLAFVVHMNCPQQSVVLHSLLSRGARSGPCIVLANEDLARYACKRTRIFQYFNKLHVCQVVQNFLSMVKAYSALSANQSLLQQWVLKVCASEPEAGTMHSPINEHVE